MEELAPAPPAGQAARLRWFDLVPVLTVTIAGVLLVFLALMAISRIDRDFYRANLQTIGLSAALAVYLTFGAGLALALRRLKSPIAFLGLRWPRAADLGLALVVLVPWYLGIVLVSALSAVLFNGGRPVPGNSTQLFLQHPRGIGILLLALLVSAVAAPLCEETFFRGMLFRLLRQRLPFGAAVHAQRRRVRARPRQPANQPGAASGLHLHGCGAGHRLCPKRHTDDQYPAARHEQRDRNGRGLHRADPLSQLTSVGISATFCFGTRSTTTSQGAFRTTCSATRPSGLSLGRLW